MELTQKQLIAILQTALSAFRAEVDEDITATRILTLLAVAEQPGIAQTDLEKALDGLSASAVSRNLLDLSSYKRNKTPGPDFLQQRPDPMYRKRHLVYPTSKAEDWLAALAARVSEAVSSK